MSNTPEGKVKERVRKIFKEYNVLYAHVPGSRFGKAGVGDYICCILGRYLEVEAKAGTKQSDLQKIRQEAVYNAGGVYIVVDESNLDGLRRVIEILLKG